MKINFDLIILDESQSIKNIKFTNYKSIMLIKYQKIKMALKWNYSWGKMLTELYSLFRFLNPTMFEFTKVQ